MRVLIVCLLILVPALALAPAAGVLADESSRRAREGVQSGDLRPLGEVLSAVTRAYPGRVVDVRLDGNVYRVKVLTPAGRVMIVRADGRSGRILGAR